MSDPMPPSAVLDAAAVAPDQAEAKAPGEPAPAAVAGNVSSPPPAPSAAVAGNVSSPPPAPPAATSKPSPFGGRRLPAPTPPSGAASTSPVQAPAGASSTPKPARFGGQRLGAPVPPAGASRAPGQKPKAPAGSRVIGQATPASQSRERPPAPKGAAPARWETLPASMQSKGSPAEQLRAVHKQLSSVLPELIGTKAHKPVLGLLEPLSVAIKSLED